MHGEGLEPELPGYLHPEHPELPGLLLEGNTFSAAFRIITTVVFLQILFKAEHSENILERVY